MADELAGTLEFPNRPAITAGYADIYHGFWTSVQGERVEVAIKEFRALIPRDRQSDPEALRRRTETRIKREVFVWSQTKHPNLHPLLGYRSRPQPRLISPWCSHGNLMDYVRENSGLSRRDKLRLINQTACGLSYLHSQTPPICHADIKPENVLVNDRLEAALSDFGLSLVLEGLGVPSGLTTTERVKGTLNYMAAELFEGEKPSRESDVYAFGGLILTVMSGKPPFSGLREPIIMRRAVQDQPPKPEDHPELPPEDSLWSLMRRCWQQNPGLRPSIQGVMAELSKGAGSALDAEPQPTNMLPQGPVRLTMSSDERAKVKSAIPESSGKILHVTLVKIYHAHPNSTSWTDIGQEGALTLVMDEVKGGLWFRMIDLKDVRGVTWEHRLHGDLTCYQDWPSFLSFSGESRMIGFAFHAEKEAAAFLEKLHDLDKYASEASQSKEMNRPPAETGKKKPKKDETALKSTISAPRHFEHVGHMSWSEHTGFSSRGVDEAWISVAGSLGKFRVTEKPIKGSKEFVRNTVDKVGFESPDATNTAYEIPGSGEGSSKPVVPLQTPLLTPSAPEDPNKRTPTPPVRRTGHARSEALVSMDWPVIPPSPPPPVTHDDEFEGVEWIMEPIVSPLESQPTPIAAAQFTHVEHVRQSEQAGLSSTDAKEKWTALIEALELPGEEVRGGE